LHVFYHEIISLNVAIMHLNITYTITIMHLLLDSVTIFHFPEIMINIVVTWHQFLFLLHWVTCYLALTLINKINQVGVTGGDW